MKSKLSYYPYARPQYEWEKVGLEERYSKIYKTYDCEEFANVAYYKAIEGDLTGKSFVQGRTAHQGEITRYYFTPGSISIPKTKAYYVKPEYRNITYSLDLEDKKNLYDYYGWDGVKDFPSEITLLLENRYNIAPLNVTITLHNTRFRYDKEPIVVEGKEGIKITGKLDYTGITMINNIYHDEVTPNLTELELQAIKDIEISWHVQYGPDYKLFYQLFIPHYYHGGIHIMTLVATDEYDIEEKNPYTWILPKKAEKHKLFTGNIEAQDCIKDDLLSKYEDSNYLDAKELLNNGYTYFYNGVFLSGNVKHPYAMFYKDDMTSMITVMKSDKQFNSYDFEPGYTLDEIAKRRGIASIEGARSTPLDPTKQYHQYTEKQYIVPQRAPRVSIKSPTVEQMNNAGLWIDNNFITSSSDITKQYQTDTYYRQFEETGPFKWKLLNSLELDRSISYLVDDADKIGKVMAFSTVTNDAFFNDTLDIMIEYDNLNNDDTYFRYYIRYRTPLEYKPIIRSYYDDIRYFAIVNKTTNNCWYYFEDYKDTTEDLLDGFEYKAMGLDEFRFSKLNEERSTIYGPWHYLAYAHGEEDIALQFQSKYPDNYHISQEEYVAAVGENNLIDKDTILWLYDCPLYNWEMPEKQDLPFAYWAGEVSRKTQYLIKEFNHYSVNDLTNNRYQYKELVKETIPEEYAYVYVDGDDLRLENTEKSDIYLPYEEVKRVDKENYNGHWDVLRNTPYEDISDDISVIKGLAVRGYYTGYKHLLNLVKDLDFYTEEPMPLFKPDKDELLSDEWAIKPFVLFKGITLYLWIPDKAHLDLYKPFMFENAYKNTYDFQITNKEYNCYWPIGTIPDNVYDGEIGEKIECVYLNTIQYNYNFNNKDTPNKVVYSYLYRINDKIPFNYYVYANKNKPSDFGLDYHYIQNNEVLETIYNENYNYLSHDDIYDYDNLTVIKYKDLAITIKNQLELGEKELLSNISYTKTINDGDSIDFTTIASASITAQLNYPVEEANKLIGKNFTYLLDYGDGEWRNMGLFTIDEAESIDAYTSRITGHDHMYRLNKYVDDFIANYQYPTTLKKFWYDLLDYCDIFYDKEELSGVNADLELNRNFEAVKTSALQIAEYITQLMAGYAHINKDNFSATISHYEIAPASVVPSNYSDISHSSYNSQVPNQIKMGYNNDKTVSTSEPISRYYEEDIPCAVIDNTEYREVVDSITYRYPDGIELKVPVGEEIKRAYETYLMDYTPISYIPDNENELFGMVVVPGEEWSRLYIFNTILSYHTAREYIDQYENGEDVPQIKAVYTPQNYDRKLYYSEYIDNEGRLFAKCYYKEKYKYFVEIYDKPEDLEEVSRETHQEVVEYHYDFKVKDYTYTVNGKPLEEISEEVDNGKYLIYINQGHATAKEYGERKDSEFIPYYITDNALITYNIDEAECKVIMANICKVLKELPLDYRKCDLTMLTPTANYEIKIGDIIEATNKLGKKFKMMVMEISIDGSGITYKSFGEAQYPVEGESINSQIIYLEDLQGQISEIRGDSQETKQEIVDITATQTELVEAVNGLNEEVIDLGANLTAFDEKYQNITNQISAEHDTDIVEVYEAIDAKAEEVKGYADGRDAETLKDAKKYTDDKTYDASAITTGILADARIPQRIWDFMNAFDGSVIVKHTHHDNGAQLPREDEPWDELWVGDTTQSTGLLFKCGYSGSKHMNITVRAGGVDILTRTLQ